MLRPNLSYKIEKSRIKSNEIDKSSGPNIFINKIIYVGIDVHRKSYSISCLCEGVIIKSVKMTADYKQLIKYLNEHFPGSIIKSVYESGFCGFSLHRKLVESGIDNMVMHAASLARRTNDKVKTDKKDSRKLAEQLAAGMLKPIYIPSEEQELSRQYPRTRSQLIKSRSRVMNQIRMKLLQFGMMPIEHQNSLSRKFVKEIMPSLPLELRGSIEILLQFWEHLQLQIIKVDKLIKEQNDKNPLVQFFKEIAGIGFVTASTLASELGDMSQFKNERTLFSYTGLTPSEYTTGDTRKLGHITKQGNPRLRGILVETAWRTIRKDPLLMEKFTKIANRAGKKRAIVAIARKLVGIARSIVINNTKYEVNYSALVPKQNV